MYILNINLYFLTQYKTSEIILNYKTFKLDTVFKIYAYENNNNYRLQPTFRIQRLMMIYRCNCL